MLLAAAGCSQCGTARGGETGPATGGGAKDDCAEPRATVASACAAGAKAAEVQFPADARFLAEVCEASVAKAAKDCRSGELAKFLRLGRGAKARCSDMAEWTVDVILTAAAPLLKRGEWSDRTRRSSAVDLAVLNAGAEAAKACSAPR